MQVILSLFLSESLDDDGRPTDEQALSKTNMPKGKKTPKGVFTSAVIGSIFYLDWRAAVLLLLYESRVKGTCRTRQQQHQQQQRMMRPII